MDIFWTVLVEGTNGGYRLQHKTLADAQEEAARLVMREGKRAFVLELVACCVPAAPAWEVIALGRRT